MAGRGEAPNHDNNPYADALKGLRLDDPVEAFFNFCREREAIRLRREKGGKTYQTLLDLRT